jgi:hypothetical protein
LEQARKDVALTGQAEDLALQLEQRLPSSYAGIWFDAKKSRFRVAVSDPKARTQARNIVAEKSLTGATTIVSAHYSWSQLQAGQSKLNDAAADAFEAHELQTGIDPIKNAVTMKVSSAASTRTRSSTLIAKKAAGVKVITKTVPAAQLEVRTSSCNEAARDCDRPLRGGVDIQGSQGTGCTAGFPMRGLGSSDYKRYIVTAGHCTYFDTGKWSADDADGYNHPIGSPISSDVNARGDFGVIKVNSRWWNESSWQPMVARWGNSLGYRINGQGRSFVGMSMCKTGVVTGNRCGTVLEVDITTIFDDFPGQAGNMTHTNVCGSPGDSGGPITAKHRAFGINSGAIGQCGELGASSFYSEITNLTEDKGLRADFEDTDTPDPDVGPRWQPWEALGGSSVGRPAVISWAYGHEDAFVRASDGTLRHRWFNGQSWQPWESLGGNWVGTPAAVSWGQGHEDVIVRGSDGAVWHRWFNGQSWQPWEVLGAPFASDPVAISWGYGHEDVFVRGNAHDLWHRWFNGQSWQPWESLGGALDGAPAVASWGSGHEDVFVRGTDGVLTHRWFNGQSWQPWESLGGTVFGTPAVVSWGYGHEDLFVRRAADNVLAHRWFNGQSWQSWEIFGAPFTGDAALVSWGPDHEDAFALGTDGTLWHRWFDDAR